MDIQETMDNTQCEMITGNDRGEYSDQGDIRNYAMFKLI